MYLNNFLLLFLFSITIPILYIKLVSGFVVSIIDRLINANFELNPGKFIDLVIGYGIGAFLFSYIFHQFFKYGVISLTDISNASITMPFLALTFCYFARVITRRNGRFSGRIYVSVVTAIASLIFLVNTAIGLNSLGETPSGLFTQIIAIGGGLESNLIIRIESSLEFLKSWIPTIALGSILMAIFGELAVVHLMKPKKLLIKEKPDMVLVYGDTNSTLAGALAASKLRIRVAHVEAGLRRFDRSMPEEINRILTDHISDLLFCPTQTAVDNLAREGITKGVHLVGDVMVDAVEYNKKVAEERSRIIEELRLEKGKYLVITVHRPGNTDNKENMTSIIEALAESGRTVVFPVHPRTENYLAEYGMLDRMPENVKVIQPLGYLDMLRLMGSAEKILTDSGGIQKEAYMLGIPCITLRENTEWVETLDGGWNVLVGADKNKIIESISNMSQMDAQRNVKNGNIIMPKKLEKIPEEFKTYEEASDFWDSHDSTGYLENLEDIEVEVDVQKRHFLLDDISDDNEKKQYY